MITYFQTSSGCCTGAIAATITGNGSDTDFVITHNFNTRNLIVQSVQVAAPYAQVVIPVEFTTVNTLTISFGVAPANGVQYVILINKIV